MEPSTSGSGSGREYDADVTQNVSGDMPYELARGSPGTAPSRRLHAVAALPVIILASMAAAGANEYASVVGRIAGDGPGHVSLDVTVTSGDGLQAVRVRPDAGGRFAAIGLTPGPVTVVVRAAGSPASRSSRTCRIPAGETGIVDITLSDSPPQPSQGGPAREPVERCRLQVPTQDRYLIE